jgi:hypothetical protein
MMWEAADEHKAISPAIVEKPFLKFDKFVRTP